MKGAFEVMSSVDLSAELAKVGFTLDVSGARPSASGHGTSFSAASEAQLLVRVRSWCESQGLPVPAVGEDAAREMRRHGARANADAAPFNYPSPQTAVVRRDA